MHQLFWINYLGYGKNEWKNRIANEGEKRCNRDFDAEEFGIVGLGI